MNISDVNNDGIGMDGFDPVSYYEGQPMRGTADIRFAIGDITYHFSSVENMEKFEAEPAKYIPMAGGYTAGTNVARPDVEQSGKQYIGDKNFVRPSGLEDTPVSIENNVPIDTKEDGDVEMQNLSDSDN